MFRSCLVLLCVLLSVAASSQSADSLFAKPGERGWLLSHPVKAGETVFSLARRYHVPPAILADANGISYQQELDPSMKLYIPLGAYNLLNGKPVNAYDARPFYIHTGPGESLFRIAHNSGVQQKTIQQWNNLDNTEIKAGRTLLVGWVLYDATPVGAPVISSEPAGAPPTNTGIDNMAAKPAAIPKPATAPVQKSPMTTQPPVKPATNLSPATAKPAIKDTLYIVDGDTISTNHVKPEAPLSEMETLFMSQTDNGVKVTEEKGPAVFYPSVTRGHTYFAFHNTAPKGTVIKVFNPGSGKTIFVKVLGPLPGTALYHNSLIGIPARAKAELGVKEDKAWCELTYAGF